MSPTKLMLVALCVGLPYPLSAEEIWGINGNAFNRLFVFDSATPGTTTNLIVSGLNAGDYLKSIDFRHSDGQLYAICDNISSPPGSLYRIDRTTGAATLLVSDALLFSNVNNEVSSSWNPVTDELRFVMETDVNRRIAGSFGPVSSDTNLAYAAGDPNFGANPRIVGLAYTNKQAPVAASTTAFGIDSDLDVLVRLGSVGGAPTSPNSGQLFTIGALGIDFNTITGFDISGNVAYATTALNHFYTIDLATGAATFRGDIAGTPAGFSTRDIAVTSIPEPSTAGLALAGAAFAAMARRLRRRIAPSSKDL